MPISTPPRPHNGSDRYDSSSMVELGEMIPIHDSAAHGFRARIKAKREQIAREAKERRAGDGQGGGMRNYFVGVLASPVTPFRTSHFPSFET